MTAQKYFRNTSLKIGWIGTGIMGRWMCQNLLEHGPHQIYVHSRTLTKCKPLVDQGATLSTSVRSILNEQVDVIICMAGFPAEVEQIVFGDQSIMKENSKLNQSLPIFVDMSTNSPSLSKRIASAFEEQGSFAIDAPVSGGEIGAKNRTLSVMTGGPSSLCNELETIIFCHMTDLKLGGSITHLGPSGSGQQCKIVNQILISSSMIAVCEALLFAKRLESCNLEKIIETVQRGAGNSWSLSNLGPKIAHQDFKPGFRIEHFIKDLEIALEEARRLDVTLPGLSLAHKLYKSMTKHYDTSQMGTQALILALESMNQQES